MSLNPAPVRQHLAAYEVLPAMKREAEYFLTRTHGQTTEVTPWHSPVSGSNCKILN